MTDPQSAIYAARPTLSVDGRASDALTDGLVSLTITEDLAGLARCEVTLNNWGPAGDAVSYLLFDMREVDFGRTLTVALGDDTLFEGQVSAVGANYPAGASPELVLLVDDRLQALRATRRTRSFERVSDADVVQTIASDHGLQADVDLQGPTWSVLAQVNQSDLAFLRERARAVDAELWVDGRTLRARACGSDRAAPVELALGEGLWSFEVLADLAHQRTSLVASGWDVASKSAATHEATDAVIQSTLGGDRSGAAVLRSAFGARKDQVAHALPADSAEARRYAEGAFRAMARRFVVGRGVAAPDASLRAGRRVKLGNLGALFDGAYLLTEVSFVYDLREGLRVEFEVDRPGIGNAGASR